MEYYITSYRCNIRYILMEYYLGILDIPVGYLYTGINLLWYLLAVYLIMRPEPRTHSAMMSIEYFSVLCKNIK
jgi:hypothetical protein